MDSCLYLRCLPKSSPNLHLFQTPSITKLIAYSPRMFIYYNISVVYLQFLIKNYSFGKQYISKNVCIFKVGVESRTWLWTFFSHTSGAILSKLKKDTKKTPISVKCVTTKKKILKKSITKSRLTILSLKKCFKQNTTFIYLLNSKWRLFKKQNKT